MQNGLITALLAPLLASDKPFFILLTFTLTEFVFQTPNSKMLLLNCSCSFSLWICEFLFYLYYHYHGILEGTRKKWVLNLALWIKTKTKTEPSIHSSVTSDLSSVPNNFQVVKSNIPFSVLKYLSSAAFQMIDCNLIFEVFEILSSLGFYGTTSSYLQSGSSPNRHISHGPRWSLN